MIVKFSKLKSSSCTLRITGQEPKFLFCFNIKLIKWCSGLTTQNRSRAAQLSEGCETKGRAERQLCSRSSAVSRPAAHPRSSLGRGRRVCSFYNARRRSAHSQWEEGSERTRESWTFEQPRCGERLMVSFGVVGGKGCGRLNNCGPHSAIGRINRQC